MRRAHKGKNVRDLDLMGKWVTQDQIGATLATFPKTAPPSPATTVLAIAGNQTGETSVKQFLVFPHFDSANPIFLHPAITS
jgi:hypothetical protein